MLRRCEGVEKVQKRKGLLHVHVHGDDGIGACLDVMGMEFDVWGCAIS